VTFEPRSAYEAVAIHLEEAGLRPSIRGDGLHIGVADIVLGLRIDPEHPPEDDVPAMLVWLDVFGVDDRPMRFDLAGWGQSAIERTAELAHGIADSIVPPLRWLAGDPRVAADSFALEEVDAWDVYVGRPWVVVASGEGEAVEALAEDIRGSLTTLAAETVRRLRPVLLPLTDAPMPHWIKVYIASYPSGPDGRIDVDSTDFWSGVELARSFTWPSPTATQIVRQLVVIKPRAHESERVGASRDGIGARFRRRLLGADRNSR
jgi:hypothetical protein